MRIAVFGGSGVIGGALLPELVRAGHTLRGLQHRTPLAVEGVEVVEGSITEPAAVAATVAEAEVVLQLTKGGGGIEQAAETSVRGTINILDAVRQSGAVTHYLLTSSDAATGIGAHPYPEPISHRTRPISYGDYYSLGKVLEETIVLDYDRNGGLPYTIARLSWTQREDLVLRHFIAGYDRARPLKGLFSSGYTAEQKRRLESGEPFVVVPLDAAGRPLERTLVSLPDVTRALVAMIGNPRARQETFHLSGPVFRYDQPARYLAEKRGLAVEEVPAPEEHSYDIDITRTTEQIGWTPQDDVLAMIDAALTWSEEHAV